MNFFNLQNNFPFRGKVGQLRKRKRVLFLVSLFFIITVSEVCVVAEEEEGPLKAGTVCEGDSGGPLIVRVRHHRQRQPHLPPHLIFFSQ